MTIQEAVAYIEAATWSQWRLGLGRTRELLQRLGNPQKTLKFVHVAGTNGKGSTCAMLESILRCSGYRTGLYPSPFIEDFRERIQVCGEWIGEEALCRLTERVKQEADDMEDHPSQFEIITAIGMLYFAEQACDLVVLEVGMGGRFDSTNVIDAPETAVITNIGLDHTDYLGTTLAEIAETKGGIIKRGTAVVAYPSEPEALDVIRDICADNGCPLTIADFDRIVAQGQSLRGQDFCWRPDQELHMPLLGVYQLRNAAVALTVTETLRERGWHIPDEAVRKGMEQVRWPARFEVLRPEPPFILDGGHNLQCAEAAAESLQLYLPDQRPVLLIGMLADKDYEAVLDVLLPLVRSCVCVTPPSDRALPGSELARIIQEKGYEARASESIPEAVAACRNGSAAVFAFGSLYLAGEIRKQFRA